MPLDLENEEMPAPWRGTATTRPADVRHPGRRDYVHAGGGASRVVSVHRLAPAGSSVVFDFASRTMIEGLKQIDLASIPPVARPSFERFLSMIRDEPWLFGFPVGGEKEFLADLGLELRELLTIGSEESVRRYLTRADGTTVGGEGHAKAEALRKAAQTKQQSSWAPTSGRRWRNGCASNNGTWPIGSPKPSSCTQLLELEGREHRAAAVYAALSVCCVRKDLNPARSSSVKIFGCSQAAKCPPLSTLL